MRCAPLPTAPTTSISKPFDPDTPCTGGGSRIPPARASRKTAPADEEPSAKPSPGILTRDAGMQKLCRNVEKSRLRPPPSCCWVSRAPAKSCSRAVCINSASAPCKKFVAINCAAIPENLLESEIVRLRKRRVYRCGQTDQGQIEYADGGVHCFWMRSAILPLPLQAKLLRVSCRKRVVETAWRA